MTMIQALGVIRLLIQSVMVWCGIQPAYNVFK